MCKAGLTLGTGWIPGIGSNLNTMPLFSMGLTGCSLDKKHATSWRWANEWFLPCMKLLVVVQSVSFVEFFMTEITGILFHSIVHVHVLMVIMMFFGFDNVFCPWMFPV